MDIVSARRIDLTSNTLEANMFGIFTKQQSKIVFFFRKDRSLHYFDEALHSWEKYPVDIKGCTIPLPYDWYWSESHSCLLFSDFEGINIANKCFLSPLPTSLRSEYINNTRSAKHLVEDDFQFEDYCISHKGMMGYSCTRNGRHLWDFRGRAYLFTEIERYKNVVYFGTGGAGGYFYALNLDTGMPIVALKTGGTSCIERIGHLCYFLQCDKETSLVCVNLLSGDIEDRIQLSGTAMIYSRLKLIDDKLHAITFQYQKKQLQAAFWHTVQI